MKKGKLHSLDKKSIYFVKGDATVPQKREEKETIIIAHITNTINGKWEKGFVGAITSRFGPEPSIQYQSWNWEGESGGFRLGAVQFVKVEENVWIANMVAQQGFGDSKGSTVRCSVKYEALEECLNRVNKEAKKLKASVHMPRIGCGLGGANWETIQNIIQKNLSDTLVFVYDFE